MEKQTENSLMDMGREKERVGCMERVTGKLNTVYKIDSQWKFAMWLRKLKPGLCINLEGWDGREVQKGGDICV